MDVESLSGVEFQGWYAQYTGSSSSYTNMGRDYMYTNKLSIHAEIYREDWSAKQVALSCTETGGYALTTQNGNFIFWLYESGVGYKTPTSTKSLSTGWHTFDLVFDGTYAMLYIDDTLEATSAAFTNGIGYHSSNSLILGGEALKQLWVFIIAPLVGGALAAVVYNYLNKD